MKKSIWMTLMMAALTLMWGCKSSDSNDDDIIPDPKQEVQFVSEHVDNSPKWEIDWTYNDAVPDWQEIDTRNYETWAIYMLKLEKELAKYASEDDMMAVFVDGQLRAFANPAVQSDDGRMGENVYFILKVYGNENKDKVLSFELKYYSQKLHHLFTINGNIQFEAEKIYGVETDDVVPLLMGSNKFPYQTDVFVNRTPAENSIQLSTNDMIAAFVGDECRGVAYLNEDMIADDSLYVTVHMKEIGETVTLRYYSSKENKVLTFTEKVTPDMFPSPSIYVTF